MSFSEFRRSFIKRTASFRKKKNPFQKADKITDLNDEDRDTFIEFKKRIFGDLQDRHTDVVLLRFLKARSFKLNDAEKLFHMDISFRRLLDAENILDYIIPEVYEKYNVSGFIGFDKEGSPVRVMNLGQLDIKGINHSLSSTELLKLIIWYLEVDSKLMKDENKRTGQNADSLTFIINIENISFHQIMYKPGLDNAMVGLKMLQDHFCEIIKTIYIINAPAFFSTVYNLLRPVIQENLHKRIKIYSSENWINELTQQISSDVLPVYLGGRRVDCNKNPYCKKFINFGGTIPESYYLPPDSFLSDDDPEVMTAIIPSGSYCHFRYPIFEVGTEISLHISSKEFDIGFGFFLENLSKDQDTDLQAKAKDLSKMEQLCPIIRCQCQIAPEIRKIVAWKTGVYVLRFDNTYSWMNSKRVLFKVKLKAPEEKEIYV